MTSTMNHGLTVASVPRPPRPAAGRPFTPLAAINPGRRAAARALARIAPVAKPDMRFNAGL